MEKVIKNPSASNMKLASNKVNNNKTNADLNKTKQLISATTEMVNKMEPDVKAVGKQSSKALKKEFMLEGLG